MLGPITEELFSKISEEIKKEENQDKIKECLLEPLIKYLQSKVYTYLQFLGLLIGIIILLLILNIWLVLKMKPTKL